MPRTKPAPPDHPSWPDVQGEATRAEHDQDGLIAQGMRRGREFRDQAGEAAGRVADQVGDILDERPLAALGAGLIAGVAIGLLVGLLIREAGG